MLTNPPSATNQAPANAEPYGFEIGKDYVDEACVQQVKGLLEEAYPEVLAGFLSDTREYIEELGKALHNSNVKEAAAIAHKIKSSAGQFGFRLIQQIAKTIEQSKEMPIEKLLVCQTDLENSYHKTVDFLKQHSLYF